MVRQIEEVKGLKTTYLFLELRLRLETVSFTRSTRKRLPKKQKYNKLQYFIHSIPAISNPYKGTKIIRFHLSQVSPEISETIIPILFSAFTSHLQGDLSTPNLLKPQQPFLNFVILHQEND